MCVSWDISRRRAFEAYRQKTHRRPPERPREGCTAARPSPVRPGWPTADCCWSTLVASPWATGSPSPQLTGSQAAKGAPSCMAWAILDFYFNTISLLKKKKKALTKILYSLFYVWIVFDMQSHIQTPENTDCYLWLIWRLVTSLFLLGGGCT